MPRYLRIIWLFLGLASFVTLIGLFLMPTSWQVERSVEIATPPERVFALLDDLHAWRSWSPWQESAYQGLVFRYSGPARGVGASMSWDSQATGDGTLRIDESVPPRRLAFSMAFQKGRIEAHDVFALDPLPGGRTRVTWTDHGSLGRTLLGRLSLPVIEKSMGRDLDRGLSALAAVAEGRPVPPPAAAAPLASSAPNAR